MTARHLIDGLMRATKCRSHWRCSEMLDLPQGMLCRLYKGQASDFRVSKLIHMSVMSGVPVETLIKWFRMPDDKFNQEE